MKSSSSRLLTRVCNQSLGSLHYCSWLWNLVLQVMIFLSLSKKVFHVKSLCSLYVFYLFLYCYSVKRPGPELSVNAYILLELERSRQNCYHPINASAINKHWISTGAQKINKKQKTYSNICIRISTLSDRSYPIDLYATIWQMPKGQLHKLDFSCFSFESRTEQQVLNSSGIIRLNFN